MSPTPRVLSFVLTSSLSASYPDQFNSTGDALGDSSESTPAANGLVGYPNGRALPTGTHKGSRPGDHRNVVVKLPRLSKGCLEYPERRRRLERQDPACFWSRLSGWDPRKSDPPPTRLSTSHSTATGARIVISCDGSPSILLPTTTISPTLPTSRLFQNVQAHHYASPVKVLTSLSPPRWEGGEGWGGSVVSRQSWVLSFVDVEFPRKVGHLVLRCRRARACW
ncbi:hypothetical protein B0H13DRAFT_2687268 [Mycena leptocephala]|nr:hypothetical protein B0H13DRAFT_2687268 [Mycena leptocephala]